MKKVYFLTALGCMMAASTSVPCWADDSSDANYTISVLTFENDDYLGDGNMLGEKNWSSLIDNPQYGGPLLYGPDGYGYFDAADNYYWYDQNNTELYSELNYSYGAYCFWNGGIAVSNYVTDNCTGKSYEQQLEAYSTTGKGGYDDSDNFVVCNGYFEEGGYSDSRPIMKFNDNTARVIDHLYLALPAYTIDALVNGSSMCPAATAENYVDIVFEGLDSEGASIGDVAYSVLTDGQPLIGYAKVDLSPLGEVSALRMNIESDIANDYGMAVPAYYILDNIAVRMPKSDSIDIVNADQREDNAIYTIDGRRVSDMNRPGFYIVNGKKILVK